MCVGTLGLFFQYSFLQAQIEFAQQIACDAQLYLGAVIIFSLVPPPRGGPGEGLD